MPGWRTTSRLLFAAIVCVTPLACGGDDDPGPVLGPVNIDITIQDTSGTDPAVYFQKVLADGDMLTVDVMLRTATTVDYDAFNLEIHYDPTHVQINQTFAAPTSLGMCGALDDGCASGGMMCEPLCCTNAVDANFTGTLLIGVSKPAGCTVTSAADQTLTRLIFLGATAGTSFLELIATANTGDCEILARDPVTPTILNDLNIPCLSGMAQIDSTR